MTRIHTRVLAPAAAFLAVAVVFTATAGRGGQDITRPRLERAIGPTFANLTYNAPRSSTSPPSPSPRSARTPPATAAAPRSATSAPAPTGSA
jgi:hypothetical protein